MDMGCADDAGLADASVATLSFPFAPFCAAIGVLANPSSIAAATAIRAFMRSPGNVASAKFTLSSSAERRIYAFRLYHLPSRAHTCVTGVSKPYYGAQSLSSPCLIRHWDQTNTLPPAFSHLEMPKWERLNFCVAPNLRQIALRKEKIIAQPDYPPHLTSSRVPAATKDLARIASNAAEPSHYARPTVTNPGDIVTSFAIFLEGRNAIQNLHTDVGNSLRGHCTLPADIRSASHARDSRGKSLPHQRTAHRARSINPRQRKNRGRRRRR